MRSYRPSMYNYIVQNGKNRYILYNSLSKKISLITEETKKYLCSNQNFEEETKRFVTLKANGYIVPSELDERQMADYFFLREITDNRLDLTIMPTEECNFRCKYCYEDFEKGRMNDETRESIYLFLQKNIRKYNGMSINWFGGEPTLEINTIRYLSERVIALCKERRIPYSAGITTNGYLLSEENFALLLKCRIQHFQVTVDGTEQFHDRYKRTKEDQPTYWRVINNLMDIKDKFKGKRFNITIRTNVSLKMLDKLNDIVKFYKENLGDDERFDFYFRPVGDWGGDRVKEIEMDVFDHYRYSEVYSKLVDIEEKLNYRMYYLELTKNVDICYAARLNSYIIGADGTVYKCSTIFNEDINHVGYLTSKGKLYLDEEKEAKWGMIGFSMVNTKSNCASCKLLNCCHNATCIADQVREKAKNNCPQLKNSMENILRLVVKNEKYIDYMEDCVDEYK